MTDSTATIPAAASAATTRVATVAEAPRAFCTPALTPDDAVLNLVILDEAGPYTQFDVLTQIYPALVRAADGKLSHRRTGWINLNLEVGPLIESLTGLSWLGSDSPLWRPHFAAQVLRLFYDGRFYLDATDLRAAQRADADKKASLTTEHAVRLVNSWGKHSFALDALTDALRAGDPHRFDLVSGPTDFLRNVGRFFNRAHRAYFQPDSPLWHDPIRVELLQRIVDYRDVRGTGPNCEFHTTIADASVALHELWSRQRANALLAVTT